MESVEYSRWKIECDRDATRAAYALVPAGTPERCGCLHCRNFAAARTQVYGQPMLAIFDRLGIDREREAEVYHNARLAPGLHSYGGWFHFVGILVSGADSRRPIRDDLWTRDLQSATPRLSVGFTAGVQLVPASFKGLQLVQFEFTAEVPWVLHDPEPE